MKEHFWQSVVFEHPTEEGVVGALVFEMKSDKSIDVYSDEWKDYLEKEAMKPEVDREIMWGEPQKVIEGLKAEIKERNNSYYTRPAMDAIAIIEDLPYSPISKIRK